jgi:hypothetical protein
MQSARTRAEALTQKEKVSLPWMIYVYFAALESELTDA